MKLRLRLSAALAGLAIIACNPSQSPLSRRSAPLELVAPGGIDAVEPEQGPRQEALPVAASAEEAKQLLAAAPTLQTFLGAEGQGWTVAFDRRSGLPAFLEGPGIPFIPGAGNSLERPDVTGAALSELAVSEARALLARHPGLLGVPDEALVLDRAGSGAQDSGDTLHLVSFRYEPAGVEVRDARVTFVVRHGNLVQLHAEHLVPRPEVAQPELAAADALAVLKDRAGISRPMKVAEQRLQLVLLATTGEPAGVYSGPVGQGYGERLAYTFRFLLADDARAFGAYVDARSGELFELYDANRYASVSGGIYPRTSSAAAETVVPFERVRLTNGASKISDLGGGYNYGGGSALAALTGAYVSVSDSCGAPSANAGGAPGDLLFGTSAGTDCTLSPTGNATRAARNAFYHLEHVRQVGTKWLDGANSRASGWFTATVGANVNIAQTCNAFWNGSTVNFYRSGGGCNNTGEISDVMQHEWGHGLDTNTKTGSTGDSAKGEAVADTVALLMTHDKCVGPNFRQTNTGETPECSTAVRDLTLPVTLSNISTRCALSSRCSGALGYECHCESHLLSGAHYDLAQAFVARYGLDEGWHQFEHDFLLALPAITAYLSRSPGNAYAAFMAADDDNGNPFDGTPNADLIYQAFNAHGLAGAQQPVSTRCPARQQPPTLTATAHAGAVGLSWTPVTGATRYTVLRNMVNGGATGFVPAGLSVTGTSATDEQVAPGSTYQYVVYASIDGCSTPLSARASATPTAPASNFSMAISSASQTVAPGGSATFNVVTVQIDGAPENVTFSLTGLAPGVTASFNPPAVVAGAPTVLTLTAASSAPAATSNFVVTATAPSIAHRANASLVVYTRGPAVVGNGGFEAGSLVEWASGGTALATLSGHTGDWTGQVGSIAPNTDSEIRQTVTLPSGSPGISFWYKTVCPDTVAYDWSLVEMRSTTGTVLATLLPKTCTNDGTWVNVRRDLSQWAGQTVSFYFMTHEDNSPSDHSYTLYDDIVIDLPVPDTTPPTASVTFPLPKQIIWGQLTVRATGSDDATVSKLSIYLDGTLQASGGSTALSWSWDTSTATNGRHILTAVAQDAAGNTTTSSQVLVTVQN